MSQLHQKEESGNSIIQELIENPRYPNLILNIEQDIFPIAQVIPESLTINLLSDQRVIKLIKSGNDLMTNLLRGFYYQLLRLCYDMEDQQSSKDYLQITKNIVFDRSVIEQSDLNVYFKHVAQFISLMEESQEMGYQDIISKYHEIDESFVIILQQLLPNNSQLSNNQNEIEVILNELCEYFEITLLPNHPYYQFQESNVFIYIENNERVYLIYDEGDQDEQQESSESHQNRSKITNNEQQELNHANQPFKQQILSKYPQTNNTEYYKEAKSRPISNKSKQEKEYTGNWSGNEAIITKKYQYQKPEHQSSYFSSEAYKQPFQKISSPYQFTSPIQSIDTYKMISTPRQQKSVPNSVYPSPSPTNDMPKQKHESLASSHYVNNSLSQYYEGYYGQVQHNNSIHSNNSKNDTIMNLFGEMLKSGKLQNQTDEYHNRQTKKNIHNTQKILEDQEQFQKHQQSEIYPTFAKRINKMNTVDMINRAMSVKSINQHNSDLYSNSINGSKTLQYSVTERAQPKQNQSIYQMENDNHIYNTFHRIEQNKGSSVLMDERHNSYTIQPNAYIKQVQQKSRSVVNFDEDESIFYKPKMTLKAISEVTASKQSFTGRNVDRNDDSKGSIYKQFSDTRILKLLKEPHKTKVQIMRNRFKGQHFNFLNT